jgi:hypothetical protein
MGSLAKLVAFVFCLLVAGAYNYHRNAYLDEELEFRSYRGIKDADLALLTDAYQDELKGLQTRYTSLGDPAQLPPEKGGRPEVRVNLRQFERTQRANERRKDLHREILEREVELEQLRTEQRIRDLRLDQAWRRILRRVTTL